MELFVPHKNSNHVFSPKSFETKYGKLLRNHNHNQYHNHSFAHHSWFELLAVNAGRRTQWISWPVAKDKAVIVSRRTRRTQRPTSVESYLVNPGLAIRRSESQDPGNSTTNICRELICEIRGSRSEDRDSRTRSGLTS